MATTWCGATRRWRTLLNSTPFLSRSGRDRSHGAVTECQVGDQGAPGSICPIRPAGDEYVLTTSPGPMPGAAAWCARPCPGRYSIPERSSRVHQSFAARRDGLEGRPRRAWRHWRRAGPSGSGRVANSAGGGGSSESGKHRSWIVPRRGGRRASSGDAVGAEFVEPEARDIGFVAIGARRAPRRRRACRRAVIAAAGRRPSHRACWEVGDDQHAISSATSPATAL